MKTRTKNPDSARNNSLENIIGNLLIAEQQAAKLKNILVDTLNADQYGLVYDGDENAKKDSSTFPFIHDGKMYKIHIDIEKVKNESMV